MMDATLRALMAVDEIPRDYREWRSHSNRPYTYQARSSMKPLPRS